MSLALHMTTRAMCPKCKGTGTVVDYQSVVNGDGSLTVRVAICSCATVELVHT